MRGANGHRPYTPIEIEQVRAIATAGENLAAWARANGRTPRSVHQFCTDNGIVHAKWANRARWTPELKAQVAELRAGGKTRMQIAALIGVSLSSLHAHCWKALIEKRAPGAKAKPRSERPAKRRNCLSCAKPFKSKGPGNRMCGHCCNSHPSLGAGPYAI